jgi:hypothetical protein
MDGLRIVPGDGSIRSTPCSQCGGTGQGWDRIAGQPYCPDCEENLARGEAPPLVVRTEKQRCCVCHRVGIVRYQTVPLGGTTMLELDLCPHHFRCLLARRLEPSAFYHLARQLNAMQLSVARIFLLHDAFYDRQGQALQPVQDEE